MKQRPHTVGYGFLALIGVLLFCVSITEATMTPPSEACTSNPNCPDGWTVQRTQCEWFCNCGQQSMPYTCYTEEGKVAAGPTGTVLQGKTVAKGRANNTVSVVLGQRTENTSAKPVTWHEAPASAILFM
jgi:hypothetical protein